MLPMCDTDRFEKLLNKMEKLLKGVDSQRLTFIQNQAWTKLEHYVEWNWMNFNFIDMYRLAVATE